MSKIEKSTFNPLSLAFGYGLKQLRGNIKSSTIGSILGVSSSFIRLLETGATNISPNRSLKLIEAFPQMEFPPLCKLLVAINVTDSYSTTLNEYKNAISDLLSAGKEDDLYFEFMLQKMTIILDQVTELDRYIIEPLLLEDKFVEAVIKFLTNNTIRREELFFVSSGNNKDVYDLQFDKILGDTPSIYVDSMSLLQKNLKTINPNLFVQDSSDWEKLNSQNFVKLIGVFTDFNRILREENLKNFDYKYLQNKTFKELHYIILDADGKDYRQDFVERLQVRWNTNKLSTDFEKITLKVCKPEDALLKSILLSRNINQSYSMIWIFITNQGNKIGFGIKGSLANKTPDNSIVYGEALSYSLSKDKYLLFENLWETL